MVDYCIRQNFRVENFRGFPPNHKCFPTNYGLVDWQCKPTSMLVRKFSHEWKFCTLTAKVFPLESFAVYGVCVYKVVTFHLMWLTTTVYTCYHMITCAFYYV